MDVSQRGKLKRVVYSGEVLCSILWSIRGVTNDVGLVAVGCNDFDYLMLVFDFDDNELMVCRCDIG